MIDRARMTELAETLDTVIGAHARWPDAAKRQVLHRDMEDHIVGGDPARYGMRQHVLLLAPVMPEIIEAQWAVVGVDVIHRLVDRAISLDRQHRTENLLLHREHVRSEEHTSELQSLMRISYAVFC